MKAKRVCAFFFLSVSCQFFSLVCCWSAVCGREREEGVRRGEILGKNMVTCLVRQGRKTAIKRLIKNVWIDVLEKRWRWGRGRTVPSIWM